MSDPTSFTSGGATIPVEIFRPSDTASTGAIIIAYGSDGLIDTDHGLWKTMIEGYAKDLALNGFVTLIPDYFVKTDTHPPINILTQTGLGTIRSHKGEWQATLADAVTFAKGLHGVNGLRIGLLGFSLGGHLCLRLRTIPKVLVEYFAPELTLLGGLGTSGPLMLDALIHHGSLDEIDNPETIMAQLKASGASVTVINYPSASHGFSGSDPHNIDAAAKSKATTLAFFAEHL
ncbi:MAG TPA: dienelactone hydrolase family protein [Bryobacteraceae bacterium]|jgi:dienelactone hydrolase|nr:dienelactone hydrolase family protein [Bryobacteraceae bacterium]